MEYLDQLFVFAKRLMLDLLARFLPDWIVLVASMVISIVAILIFAPLTMMYLTLLERKVVGRIQNRIGPNRVGKFGLLQPIADGIKMLTKEDIVPFQADPVLHFLAPVIIVMPALLIFAVIPFGRGMTAVDLNIGILYFIAVSSISTIAIFMASWGSRNKFSLLGGMRTVAQMISYEVPMVLSVVPVILVAETLSTNAIIEAQSAGWFVWTPWGLAGFLIFFLCAVAECNRSPFDIPEAESEIVAGFHTEYSGIKFALFYMAEFISVFAVSALAVTLFLGGWKGPWLPSWLWFLLKAYALIGVMFWFRGTLPRFRVDQLMGLAWKFLLPLALINIFVVGFWYFSPGLWKWVGSLGILGPSFWIFTKLNRSYVPENRVYRLAEDENNETVGA
ncbi:MAG: NADH-quinone oxidoreductase subunit NuoH [Candidatus Omnitrophica bacterium]|nr:NADH-quinone oxidoreductase subunit NuoH [Candidatus Omnitrophota bacterium]